MNVNTSPQADAKDAATIREIVALAHQARGIEVIRVDNLPADSSLPSEIPVGIRHGITPELLDLSKHFEPWRLRPVRIKGTAKALTLESFIQLVNRHKSADTAIFADTSWRRPAFTAVIDYHRVDHTPSFGQHRVSYEFPLSEEWKIWIGNDGQAMSQGDFAVFLEDRIAELASPLDQERSDWERDFATTIATPAALIQLSRGLQVNVESRVKNAHTLASGEGQIVWQEEHRDASGAPIKVPGLFCLSIAPFFSGEKMRVPVRLRYRVKDGKLVWFYQIYRPDLTVTERVVADLSTVGAATGLPTFEGSPEA